MVSIIVAASTNNVIGRNNQLIWHLPNDLSFFKNTTWGSVVIMGRKTFESVNKALPGRINIVITKQPQWKADNVITAKNLNDSLEKANETNCKEIFVIGGGEIYKECFSTTDRIYLTRVHAQIEGDTFFPPIDDKEWTLVSNKDFKADDRNAYDHSIQIWDRKIKSDNQ
jgi:dihydrofolate reductase